MKKTPAISTSAFLGILIATSLANAEVVPESVEAQTDGSDQVAVVDVENLRSERAVNEHGDQLIVTHARLKVREMLKGRFKQQQPEMTIEGGTVDGVTLQVSDQPKLARGEQLVVFLKERGAKHTPYRRGQGVMRVKKDRVEESNSALSEIRDRVRRRHNR
ncbi:MAG TPA: hypothetical protein VM432_00835 [Bdellovibrionales bacterium]|nr:hypothetical protein [Bdellovibrionales bacterium]